MADYWKGQHKCCKMSLWLCSLSLGSEVFADRLTVSLRSTPFCQIRQRFILSEKFVTYFQIKLQTYTNTACKRKKSQDS